MVVGRSAVCLSLIALAASCGLVIAYTGQDSKKLTLEELTVRDPHGRGQVRFGSLGPDAVGEQGFGFEILDSEGRKRCVVRVHSNYSQIILADTDEEDAVRLYQNNRNQGLVIEGFTSKELPAYEPGLRLSSSHNEAFLAIGGHGNENVVMKTSDRSSANLALLGRRHTITLGTKADEAGWFVEERGRGKVYELRVKEGKSEVHAND